MFTLHSKYKRKQKEKEKRWKTWMVFRASTEWWVCVCVETQSNCDTRNMSAYQFVWSIESERKCEIIATIAFSVLCIPITVSKSNQKCKFPQKNNWKINRSPVNWSTAMCVCVAILHTLVFISCTTKKKRNKPQIVDSDFVPWSFSTSENGIYKQTKTYFQILSRRRAFYFYSLINRWCCRRRRISFGMERERTRDTVRARDVCIRRV